MKNEEEFSEAEVLNDIERRLRKNRKVADREVRLLVEAYAVYNIPVPKDIQKIIKSFWKEAKENERTRIFKTTWRTRV